MAMAYTKAPMAYYGATTTEPVEILYNSAYTGRAITLDTSAFGDTMVCLAGTPVDKYGAVANDESAIGILLKDVYINRPQGTAVYYGTIRRDVAEKHCGITYSDEMMDALKNVVFVGERTTAME